MEPGTREWLVEAEAPFAKLVLAWLSLPRNPQASGPVIGQRCDVEPGREHGDEGQGAYVPGCWWINGRYYGPEGTGNLGHVTHWMDLPDPPLGIGAGGSEQ